MKGVSFRIRFTRDKPHSPTFAKKLKAIAMAIPVSQRLVPERRRTDRRASPTKAGSKEDDLTKKPLENDSYFSWEERRKTGYPLQFRTYRRRSGGSRCQ